MYKKRHPYCLISLLYFVNSLYFMFVNVGKFNFFYDANCTLLMLPFSFLCTEIENRMSLVSTVFCVFFCVSIYVYSRWSKVEKLVQMVKSQRGRYRFLRPCLQTEEILKLSERNLLRISRQKSPLPQSPVQGTNLQRKNPVKLSTRFYNRND